jgi:hypothetical protein
VLLAALVALGVVGTLLIAGYYSARADILRSAAASRSAQLAAEADAALVELAASWDSAGRFRQPVGASESLTVLVDDPGATGRASVTRLDACLYWLAVALTDRRDTTLTARRGAPVSMAGPVFPGPADPPPNLDRLGDDTFATLATRVDLRLAPGASVPAPVANLAEADGDLTITGGTGSGVLLVAGNITFAGPTRFRGVILASGRVAVESEGVSVSGAAFFAGGNAPKSLYKMMLQYDSSIVSNAEWHAGRPIFVAGPVGEVPR